MKRAIAILALLLSSGCGEDGAPDALPDASAADGGCTPRTSPAFTPSWRPPRSVPHACTNAQIETALALCHGASPNATECTAFNRDVANAACRACLYTTEDEGSYGALIILKNRFLRANVGGCLALADGNVSATGCGAHWQALEACSDAACMAPCADSTAFQACVRLTRGDMCMPYNDQSSCGDRTTYSPCLDNATFEEFFRAMGKIFCGDGFPGHGDAGTGIGDAAAVPQFAPLSVPSAIERPWGDSELPASGPTVER